MKFEKVAESFERLEATASRLEMTDILVELFESAPKGEIDKVAYLCLGQFAAEYEDVVIGLGDKMVVKAIAMAAHRLPKDVNKRFKRLGDLGLVAEEMMGEGKGVSLASFSGTVDEDLTVTELFSKLHKIASASGQRSQDLKIKTLAGLLAKSKPVEAKYIVRISLETMRLGTGAMTLLDALATVYASDKKKRPLVENAYNLSSDIGLIAKLLAKEGIAGVEKIKPTVGRPIKMMAAQRVKELSAIPEKMPEFAVEEKYDGERMQIHKDGETVKIFSRRLDEISHQYPDVVEMVMNKVKAKSAILEGEAVAVQGGKLQAFQVLMQRKRKYEIKKYVGKIPVRLFLFDALLLDGKDIMSESYPTRREMLMKVVDDDGKITFARRIITSKLDEIQKFFDEGLARGTEGIMAKSLAEDSVYRAGAREWLWIKWKKDYLEGMVDTFDLVLIGAIYGTGKRTGKYGTLLAATYNDDKDSFESFCKIGTGFTDENLDSMKERFSHLLSKEQPARVTVADIKPDIWFKPGIVMEVSGAEITESPAHACAKDELGKGLSLRFPRFKQYREKKAEDATSSKEVMEIYGLA